MNNLRRLIRKILLETSKEKLELEKRWNNPEDGSERKDWSVISNLRGTYHRNSFEKNLPGWVKSKVENIGTYDEYYKDRRDLKRLWNQLVDEGGYRYFWEESDEVQYFHSLGYYGNGESDELATNAISELTIANLSLKAFLKKYKPTNNRDEMSCWGVYNHKSLGTLTPHDWGLLLKGRVTYASYEDLYSESRSKATPKDMDRHKGSGLPKRPGLSGQFLYDAVIGPDDLGPGKPMLGECILDNWSIDAIVVKRDSQKKKQILENPDLMAFIRKYDIGFMDPDDVFRGR